MRRRREFLRPEIVPLAAVMGVVTQGKLPPPPTAQRRRHPEREGYLVALTFVVILTACIGAAAAAVWFLSPGLRTGWCSDCPRGVGVLVSRSADQTNWTLLFTDVPTGLSPTTTYLTLYGSGGAMLLSSMYLSRMTGGLVTLVGAGQLYMRYNETHPNALSAGDMVWIGATFAGTMTSTAGCVVQITSGSSVLFNGALQ